MNISDQDFGSKTSEERTRQPIRFIGPQVLLSLKRNDGRKLQVQISDPARYLSETISSRYSPPQRVVLGRFVREALNGDRERGAERESTTFLCCAQQWLVGRGRASAAGRHLDGQRVGLCVYVCKGRKKLARAVANVQNLKPVPSSAQNFSRKNIKKKNK